MGSFDKWANTERRRRFRGMGIAVVLMVVALLLPAGDDKQEWARTQMLWLSALFMAFQFGQMWLAMRMTRAREIEQFEHFQSGSSSSSSIPAETGTAPARCKPQASATDAPQINDNLVHDAATGQVATLSGNRDAIPGSRQQAASQSPIAMSRMSHQNRAYLLDEDRIEIRAYANIDEATRHGWTFGETVAIFAGQKVPGTAKLGDKTYVYAGLGPSRNTGLVSPDTRLFGPLCYRLQTPASA